MIKLIGFIAVLVVVLDGLILLFLRATGFYKYGTQVEPEFKDLREADTTLTEDLLNESYLKERKHHAKD
jgi:hypothetical protein